MSSVTNNVSFSPLCPTWHFSPLAHSTSFMAVLFISVGVKQVCVFISHLPVVLIISSSWLEQAGFLLTSLDRSIVLAH